MTRNNVSLAVAAATALAIGVTPVASAAPHLPTIPNIPSVPSIPTSPGDIKGAVVDTIPKSPRVQFWNTYCTVNLELQTAIEVMNRTKSPTIRDYQRNVGGSVKKMQRAMEKATRSYKSIRFLNSQYAVVNADMYRLTGGTAGSFGWTHSKIMSLPRADIGTSSAIISGTIAPKLTRTVRHYNTQSAKYANRIGTGSPVEQIHISQLSSCSTLVKKNKNSGAKTGPNGVGDIVAIAKKKLKDLIPQLPLAVGKLG